MLSITKKIEFEAAHRLSNYAGACRQIHGHTYKLEVTVAGPVDADTDMILDFKDLKKIIKSAVLEDFDHALILKDNAANRKIFEHYTDKITWMDTEPTAERMILRMVQSLIPLLPPPTRLQELKLYETSGSYASWKNIKG